VDPTKVHTIMEWPTLMNILEVHSFMGLARYYRRFVEVFFQRYQIQLQN
jgi:hypothetical protein